MAKRRLSRRQKQRIEQRQSSQINASYSNTSDEQYQHGTVVTHFGQHLDVALNHDLHVILRCTARTNLGPLVVGDEVLLAPCNDNKQHEQYTIIAALPRKTLLERPDAYGKIKPVAANIDQIIVVLAPNPKPSTLLLDRYLAAIELAGLSATIVLNKTDLWASDNSFDWEALRSNYSKLDYPVIECCAHNPQSLTSLQNHLKDKKSAFVGQSGVGKSSLVNSLTPHAHQAIREISEKSDLGQHTTTLSKLFALPQGGVIMDSPGIREFGLWHIAPAELIAGFPELDAARLGCKFNNCSHNNEPGCNIAAGLKNGTLSPKRWQNYQSILATLDQNL